MRNGDFFKHYYLIDRIGHGGMSVVHLAFDLKTKQFVALKTLFSDLSGETEYKSRFKREIEVYKTLKHPNIVSIIDSYQDSTVSYMVLEYIHGQPLGEYIDQQADHVPIHDAVSVVEGLTNALFHAHATGIVHRDVQPNNVIITPDHNVKLLDFGIAQKEDQHIHTQTGTIMGTFVYCSPEQNQGKQVDERSDLYSLGLIFYELLTGRRAIKGSSLMEITEYQLRHTIPPVKQLRFEIPDFINDIVMKLLAKWPEHRYSHSRELIDELIQVKLQSDFAELDMIFGDEKQVKFDTASKAFRSMRFDMALKLADEVLELDSDHGPAHFLKGQIFSRRSEFEKADEAYMLALSAEPKDSNIHLEYALNLYRMGKESETIEECNKILEHDPENKRARGLSTLLSGLLSGKLQPDNEFCPEFSSAAPLNISTTLKSRNPIGDNLDLVERVGILNHLLDKQNPDTAHLLSTLFPGAGDIYNGVMKRGLRVFGTGVFLICLIFLLLSASPSPDIDVYGFIKARCNGRQIVTLAKSEHLQEKVNHQIASYMKLGLIFLSFPAIGALLYLWMTNRQLVTDHYHKRHLYGRIRSTIRPGLIEMQMPVSPSSRLGEEFYVVENDPLLTINSKRMVLGTACIVQFCDAFAVCTYEPIDSAHPEPSPGDMAVPCQFVNDSLLPTPDSAGEKTFFQLLAQKYWNFRYERS